ncbi:MAG: hypothetical protein KGJ06_03960 [Pseudomonadota bacterium]|nr:hypothetical protein [Pseudomonadota bacterium]
MTIQTPLVNTAMPGTAVVHPPYDNVAPSVSNAAIDNNARGNSTPPPSPDQPSADAPATDAAFTALSSGMAQATGLGAQATFLAQLMVQDGSSVTQRFLVEYQKLLSLSNVKYKPSNAMKPSPEPSSIFGRILHDTPHQVQPAAPVQAKPQEKPQQAPITFNPIPPATVKIPTQEQALGAYAAVVQAPTPAPIPDVVQLV